MKHQRAEADLRKQHGNLDASSQKKIDFTPGVVCNKFLTPGKIIDLNDRYARRRAKVKQ